MADELLMSFDTLTKAAHEETDAADRVKDIDGMRMGATLEPGALGKLPSSDEIQATFDEVWTSAGEALEALSQACDGLAERLLATRDGNREVDDTVTDAFNQLKGN